MQGFRKAVVKTQISTAYAIPNEESWALILLDHTPSYKSYLKKKKRTPPRAVQNLDLNLNLESNLNPAPNLHPNRNPI